MNKITTNFSKFLLAAFLLVSVVSFGQTTVFSDTFTTSQGATYTAATGPVAIGTSTTWSMTRNAADWGAKIDGGILDLTNDAGATANNAGAVYAYTPLTNFISPFNATLSSNTGGVTWSFNMRTNRTTVLAGFAATTSYGLAVVLASTSNTPITTGSGYAVLMGGGTNNNLGLYYFTGGLQGTRTAVVAYGAPAPATLTNYMSVKVTYNPTTNGWTLASRDDGATAVDPLTGTLTSVGSGTNSTGTGTAMSYFGAYWQGSTGAGQTAAVDNIVVSVASGTTITSTASGNWSSTTTWSGGVVPTSADNVVIANGHTVTLDTTTGGINTRNSGTTTTVNTGGTLATSVQYVNNGTTTINGAFQLNAGGFTNSGNNFVYGATGTLNFNNTSSYGVNNTDQYWPTTSGPFNVNILQGGMTLNAGANRTVAGLFQTAAGVTQTGTLTLSGTAQLNGGGFFNSAPTYSGTATLVYNTSYTVGNEWTGNAATAGVGIPFNVTVQNSGTIAMPNSNRGFGGNLTITSGTLNLNGTSGDLYVGGNWNNAGTFNANGRAVFFNGAGAQSITNVAGETFSYLVVDKSAGTLTLANNVTINATSGNVLQLLNTGNLDINGKVLTFSGTNGNILASGAARTIASATAGTINITGTKGVTTAASGSLVFAPNITIVLTAGMGFGSGAATVNGTLQINAGGFVSSPCKYGNASLLKYNSGGNYGKASEWLDGIGTVGTTNGYPNDVQMSNNTALDAPNGTFTGALGLARDLTIDAGSAVYMDFGGSSTKSLAVGRNLILNGSLSLGNAVGGDMTIAGNWTRTGTFTPNGRQVTFNGTSSQTMTGTTTFAYLALNNSAGLVLANNAIVNNDLALTSGKTTLGTNNLTVSGAISGASSSNYVVTASTGKLVRTAVGNTANAFPVGFSATNYTPISVTNTTGTSDLSVSVKQSLTNAASDPTKIVTLEWSVTSSAATTATITPTWVAATPINQAASFTNTGAGDLAVYTTSYTNYPVTLATTTTTATGVPLQNGSNLVIVGNTGAVFSPPPANDLCVNAPTLTVGAAATSGTTLAATVTSPFSGNTDVWYKFTPTCTGTATVTIATSAQDIDIYTWSTSCPAATTGNIGTGGATSSSLTSESMTVPVTSGTTYYIRVVYFAGTSGSNAGSFTIGVTNSVVPTVALANTGTPAAGAIQTGTSNALLFGFSLTPNACASTFDFTAANIATAGTATSSDLSNFRVILDANNDGIADPGEIAAPVGTIATLANPLAFTISGQTGITAARRYLLIADVALGATPGRTFTGSLTAVNTTVSANTVTGTATGNARTINGTPPALTAAVGATVDAPFIITFTDDPTWRGNITSITVGGTTLTAGYVVSAGQITFTPSASVPAGLLQAAGTKTIAVNATGYSVTSVSQTIGVGAPTKLGFTTALGAPASNGGALSPQPVIAVQDQYGNTVTSATNLITATAGQGTWTLGGTTAVNATGGVATYTNLTASSTAAVSGATVIFSATGLTSVTSAGFNIPAPDFAFINAYGTSVTENFDTLANTGSSTTLPQGWALSEAGSGGDTSYVAGTGSGTSGDSYSFGSGAAADRAFGTLQSGSVIPTIGAKFKNNTGGAINSLAIAYVGEQWRLGATGRVDRLDFSYSLDATSLSTGTWTTVTALNFTAPTTTGTVGALDGNLTANKTNVSSAITGLNIPNGATFYIRFVDLNATGADDGLGVDDFSITACRTLAASIASNNSPICPASSATFNLTGTPNATVTYTITNAVGNQTVLLNGSGTAIVTASNVSASQTLTLVSVDEGSCSTALSGTSTVTVNPQPQGSLTANGPFCTTGTGQLTWTASAGTGPYTVVYNDGVADRTESGVTSGTPFTVFTSPVTATTTYTLVSVTDIHCSRTTSFTGASATITVVTAPNAGTLSGTQVVCSNGTTTFTSNGDAGSWSSSDTGVATVNSSTGVITPVAAGTATMTYTVTGTSPCANATATRTVTVTAAPNAGLLSGTQSVCTNGTTTFTSNGDAGNWSSNNTGVATIDALTGVITPVAAGTATITYTVAGSGPCADATATRTVTVTTAPNAGTLSGTQTICTDGTTTFTSNGDAGSWSSSDTGVATIDASTGVITPVAAGTATMTYTVTGTGPCANATATRTVTVSAAPNAGTLSGTQTICTNGTTTFTSNGDAGSWSSSDTGVATINASTGVITPVAAGTATITYTVTGTGGCSNTTATRTVTILALPTAAISGNSGAETCSGSSVSFTLTGTSGSVVTYTINNGSPDTATLTGGTATVTIPNATGTQTLDLVSVDNGTCSVSVSGTSAITIGGSTTWTGTWSNGAPTSSMTAIISANYTATGNLSACTLTVNNSAVVNIPSGFDVILNGALTVSSGSFTLENNANLLQTTNASNSGNIVVKRNSSAIKRQDYTLWSSPVAGQNLFNFSPLTVVTPTSRFYQYNSTTNQYNGIDTPSAVTMADAQGYLIRVANNHPTFAWIWNGQFTGVPHNGDYSYTMFNGGNGFQFNLVGNPYPSPISAVSFASANSANITQTLYFWRETNSTTANNAYCSWSPAGGGNGTFVTNGQPQAFDLNGVIQTGQGFFVEAINAATQVNFSNSMRVANHANQFFRQSAMAAPSEVESHRIWLNVTNVAGAFCQTAFGYMTDATQDYDLGIDGKYINNGETELYSIIDSERYVIQGRALPFVATDVVPLGFKAAAAGDYTITIDHVDGLFTEGQNVYIKDNLNGVTHDLATPYTFTTDAGTFTQRFEVVYQPALGVSNPTFENQVVIVKQTGGFAINSGSATMDNVKVFDIRGRLLLEQKGIGANTTTFNVGEANQVLIVKITSEDNRSVTKKVIN